MIQWKRVASGDYESSDGRYVMWRVPDVNPPAWNVIERRAAVVHEVMIVDGAASMRDAREIVAAHQAAV